MQAVETPRRPRPPAKIRRSLAKGSTTPPPGYVSTFAFPTSGNDGVEDVWDGSLIAGTEQENSDDDLAWLNEKSRDELTDLLVKADSLIKDRENELSLTSATCKSLYENNVALKTKHDALLQRISPNINSNTTSSPHQSPQLSVSPLRPAFPTLSRSTSEFGANYTLPEHMLSNSYSYKPRRGVSAPTLDISFLADQNAELLSKLEKLESEATSADAAGRRELRRLEKEIGLLKDELEKTQARSDELEEKAKTGFGLGAEKVVEEAWKRKQEREARIKALKNIKSHGQGSAVRNFAPDAPSPFRDITMRQFPDLSIVEEVPVLGEDAPVAQDSKLLATQVPQAQDEQLVVKLLHKIQELETTNSKILQHQTETASRLQAVQRETEFMTKIYERLNELSGQHDHDGIETKNQVSDDLVHRSVGSHRTLQSHLAAKVKRSRSFHKHEIKSRGSVVGLFDDPATELSTPRKPKSSLPVPFSEGSWGRPRHHSSYSIGSGGLASPALSSLSLSSPPAQLREELFNPMGPSLANELGDQWRVSEDTGQSRPRSLSDLSIISESPPLSPCPPSSITVQHQSRVFTAKHLPTPPGPTNSLELSIEPPTPQKGTLVTPHHESLLIGNMSPRFQVSRSLRSRNYFYSEGRYSESLGSSLNKSLEQGKRFVGDNSSPTPTRGSTGPLFFGGFQVIMDEFDERNGMIQRESGDTDVSRSPSPDPEDYADAKEELDEVDTVPTTTNTSVTNANKGVDDVEREEEVYSEDNSLSARSHTSEVSKSTVGGIMLEVWLWLQFAIIMLVFLWAMARKGPKSVLRDAERKRTLSMKKRA